MLDCYSLSLWIELILENDDLRQRMKKVVRREETTKRKKKKEKEKDFFSDHGNNKRISKDFVMPRYPLNVTDLPSGQQLRRCWGSNPSLPQTLFPHRSTSSTTHTERVRNGLQTSRISILSTNFTSRRHIDGA